MTLQSLLTKDIRHYCTQVRENLVVGYGHCGLRIRSVDHLVLAGYNLARRVWLCLRIDDDVGDALAIFQGGSDEIEDGAGRMFRAIDRACMGYDSC